MGGVGEAAEDVAQGDDVERGGGLGGGGGRGGVGEEELAGGEGVGVVAGEEDVGGLEVAVGRRIPSGRLEAVDDRQAQGAEVVVGEGRRFLFDREERARGFGGDP